MLSRPAGAADATPVRCAFPPYVGQAATGPAGGPVGAGVLDDAGTSVLTPGTGPDEVPADAVQPAPASTIPAVRTATAVRLVRMSLSVPP